MSKNLVWDEESIRLFRTGLAFVTMLQSFARQTEEVLGAPPRLDAIKLFRLLDETVTPGMEVDEPFIQSFKFLVDIGRRSDSKT